MRHRVISPCYVAKIYRDKGQFVYPTDEESERLIWAGCLVKDPEPVKAEAKPEPEPKPDRPEVDDSDKPKRKRKRK